MGKNGKHTAGQCYNSRYSTESNKELVLILCPPKSWAWYHPPKASQSEKKSSFCHAPGTLKYHWGMDESCDRPPHERDLPVFLFILLFPLLYLPKYIKGASATKK